MTTPDRETTEEISTTLATICDSVHHALTDHPHKIKMNYCTHFFQSISMSLYMAKGAIVLGIHAVFPFLLKDSPTVRQLHQE